MRLFYFLFALYTAGHVYVFICMRRAFGGGKWLIPLGAWLLVMAASWFWRFGKTISGLSEKFQDIAFFWMGFLILLCYCLIAVDLASLFSRIVSLLSRTETPRQLAAFLSATRTVPFALIAAALLYGHALYEAQTPRIVEVPITTPKLAKGTAPIRIAGIADVHVSSIIGPFMLTRMAETITRLNPDILLLAGDLVDTDISDRHRDAAILAAIPTTFGKAAVTGNHEYYHGPEESIAFMERCGFTVLRGNAVTLGGVTVAGVDDSNFSRSGNRETISVARALANTNPDRYCILLNHKPYYDKKTVGEFDLQFSGHTHEGQIWPGTHVTRAIYGSSQGLTVLREGERKSLLYITSGIGFWGPPIRFFAPPEITVFTLRPE